MVNSAIFSPLLELGFNMESGANDFPQRCFKLSCTLVWARPAGKQEPPKDPDFNHGTHIGINTHEPRSRSSASRWRDCVPLTCNINGIPIQERARYGRLVEALRHAIQKRRELPDGYAFQMDTQQIDTSQLVEWVELERKCCPFFGFELRWDGQNNVVWLNLTGPEGVKDFIIEDFGLR
jgi:hypothetical protein